MLRRLVLIGLFGLIGMGALAAGASQWLVAALAGLAALGLFAGGRRQR
jgi:hypothetical protein